VISVVVPVHNEERSLELLYDELRAALTGALIPALVAASVLGAGWIARRQPAWRETLGMLPAARRASLRARRFLSFPIRGDATWIAVDRTRPGYLDRTAPRAYERAIESLAPRFPLAAPP
jgi:hypothetical protein